ncbi:MAG: segregation/condensation protein A [Candidatus Omnitrophica bacterium]|nr:segregation/condensation protein A [Candidatus Omnitrophota bacterium]MCM8793058.1 segregation/condensation protein A [Candidatus Omnitrophota bacterium]
MSYQVRIEVFEGPLDLLLYLIKKNEVSIFDIPIAQITEQYLEYLNLMEMLDLNISGEFLVMAATLMHIKSKMLLPPEEVPPEEEEEDPRAELVKRLLEYARFKEAALALREKELKRKEEFIRPEGKREFIDEEGNVYFEASLFDLISAFSKAVGSVSREIFQEIIRDEVTVEEKIHELLHLLMNKEIIYFRELLDKTKTKIEVIVTFLAILELIRLKEIIARQRQLFGEIEIIRNEKHRFAPIEKMG